MREIQVVFQGNLTKYSYLTDDLTIKVGDEVVIIGPYGTKIAKVAAVDTATGKATKPIVCKVDVEAFEQKCLKIERQLELKLKIQNRVKELTEGALVNLLAQQDPELAALLKQQQTI